MMRNDAPEAHDVVRAQLLFRAGQSESALAIVRELTNQRPKDPDLWRTLGGMLAASDRHAEAIEAYTRATWLVARHTETWVAMAVAAYRLGRHKDSVAYWKSALETEPAYFHSHPGLEGIFIESRKEWSDIPAIVRRAAMRADPAAALSVLDAIVGSVDIEEALAALDTCDVAALPVALAIGALGVVAGRPNSVNSLRSVFVSIDSGVRDALFARIAQWIAMRCAGDQDAALAALCSDFPERWSTRILYRLTERGTRSRTIAVGNLCRSVLDALRAGEAAA